ncbi:hypothetical protein MHBO_000368 [Bonamia ostreae]|uniref:SEC63 domain-containing protein n=1 Tax=Bonamia ostreae TaxID=126728 RepID=A0ABV2AGM3_9EUKA
MVIAGLTPFHKRNPRNIQKGPNIRFNSLFSKNQTLEKILTSLMNEMVATDFWARQLIMKKGMKMDTINEINNLKIPFVPIKSLIILRQHLSQKLRFGGDGLEQIPHVDSRMAKFLHKNKISSFFKFLDSFGEISLGQNSIAQQKIKMPTKTLLGFLKNLNEAKIKDINCFIEAVPHIDIKTAIDGGNEILEGEKFSLNISLRRLSRQGSLDFTEVKEEIKKLSSVGANKIKAKGGPNVDTENNKIPKGKTKVKKQKIKTLKMRQQAHCPFFPTKKFENWTVVVQKRGQNSFEAIKTISFDRENFNWKLEILPEENGRFVYDITVYSDCYVDLKFSSEIEINVENDEKTREKSNEETAGEDNEVLEELKEEEESLLSMKWYDVITLILMAVIAYFIIPETDIGRRHVIPLVSKIQRFLYSLITNQ